MRHRTSVSDTDFLPVRLFVYAAEFFNTLVRDAHGRSMRSRGLPVQGVDRTNSAHLVGLFETDIELHS